MSDTTNANVGSVQLPTPTSRTETLLNAIATGVESSLTPLNRKETFLKAIAENSAAALKEPSSGIAVGKYFRVASIDSNGHPILEYADGSSGGSDKVFIATYGTSTATEVASALTGGKIVVTCYTASANEKHWLQLVDETDGKYVFSEASVSTENSVTTVSGVSAALNKSTSAWELVTGGSTVYSKPNGGIPKTDLASAVQTSLGLADTSEQKSRMVTSISDTSDNEHYPSAKAVYNAFGGLFTVATTSNNTDWGTVSAGGTYLNGHQITVTATANSGYSFVAWKNVRTNEILSSSASYTFTVRENIALKAVFQDESYIVPSWATGTDAEIAQAVAYHHDGLIDLSLYWSVGDTRTVSLDAMSADSTKGYEAHAAQTVELVLLDSTCTGFTLTDTGGTPVFIVGQKDGLLETGQMNSSNTNAGGWGACKRRGWCNDVYRMAIPSTLRSIFKQFTWQYVQSGTDGTLLTANDYFALAPEKAIFGSRSYSRTEEEALFSQWSYYAQGQSYRVKHVGTSGSASNWREASPTSGDSSGFCYVYSNGSAYYSNASYSYLLAPFGCI